MARLPEEEIQRRYQENLEIFRGSITDEQAFELWPDMAPGERTRRRKLKETQQARYATVVDDETGQRLLGGPQKHSQAAGTNRSILEAVAELANGERQKDVLDALFSGLDKNEAPAVRGKAAERVVKIAAEQIEVERRDREELRKLGEDELVDRLAGLLLESDAGGQLIAALVKGNGNSQKAISATATEIHGDDRAA